MGSLSQYKNLITFAKAPKSTDVILAPYKDLIKSLKDDNQWKSSFLIPLKDEPWNISNVLSQIVQQELRELKKYIPDFSISNLNNDIYKFKEFYDLSEEDSTIHCILEVFQQLPMEAYNEPIYVIIHTYTVDTDCNYTIHQEEILGYTKSEKEAIEYVKLTNHTKLTNKGDIIYRPIYPIDTSTILY